MRKVILDLAVTLDGFIEGPNGEIDWCADMDDESIGTTFSDFIDSVDTIFYGRVSYDAWGNWQPDETASPEMAKIYTVINSKKKYVFSSTKKEDGKATFIDGNIKERVEEIKQQPGKDIWLYGGGKLITSFINLGLIDVYRMAVHPVILGAGKPLFSGIKERVPLKFGNVKASKSGVLLMSYYI